MPKKFALLIPGGPGIPAASMEFDAACLPEGFEAILIDPPGSGATPAPEDRSGYHPSAIADYYAAECDSRGLVPDVVLGASFGGLVALALATRRPDLVPRLILVSTLVQGPEAGLNNEDQAAIDRALARHRDAAWYPQARGVFDAWPELVESAKNGGQIQAWTGTILPLYLSAPDQPDVRQRLSRLTARLTQNLDAMRVWESEIYATVDMRPLLSEVGSPTLVVCGEHDWIAGPRFAARLASTIRDSRLEVLPDCGHIPSIEVPGKYSAVLRNWLDS